MRKGHSTCAIRFIFTKRPETNVIWASVWLWIGQHNKRRKNTKFHRDMHVCIVLWCWFRNFSCGIPHKTAFTRNYPIVLSSMMKRYLRCGGYYNPAKFVNIFSVWNNPHHHHHHRHRHRIAPCDAHWSLTKYSKTLGVVFVHILNRRAWCVCFSMWMTIKNY